jgi:hypothetical protein
LNKFFYDFICKVEGAQKYLENGASLKKPPKCGEYYENFIELGIRQFEFYLNFFFPHKKIQLKFFFKKLFS